MQKGTLKNRVLSKARNLFAYVLVLCVLLLSFSSIGACSIHASCPTEKSAKCHTVTKTQSLSSGHCQVSSEGHSHQKLVTFTGSQLTSSHVAADQEPCLCDFPVQATALSDEHLELAIVPTFTSLAVLPGPSLEKVIYFEGESVSFGRSAAHKTGSLFLLKQSFLI